MPFAIRDGAAFSSSRSVSKTRAEVVDRDVVARRPAAPRPADEPGQSPTARARSKARDRGNGAFTADEVMLTIRPKRRLIMGSIVALISSIARHMFKSSALIQSSRDQSRKSPAEDRRRY